MMKEFLLDVRDRVDEIADKYIRPEEGTFDFALMYVPAESIHYEIISQDEKLGEGGSLLDYAAAKRVIPVSPNSLLAYLQVIALGLKGMKVEKEARRIVQQLEKVHAGSGLPVRIGLAVPGRTHQIWLPRVARYDGAGIRQPFGRRAL